ncbi:MAG: hypothetical protein SFZ03_06990 [Candidatus Melainabacteria bacterium]|nr:hypothetical protein [Candidatus Melainabacteria bacterium]
MTQTKITLAELQQNIAHLSDVSDEGYVLSWGHSSGVPFELVCKSDNTDQMARLDVLVSHAYEQAKDHFAN